MQFKYQLSLLLPLFLSFVGNNIVEAHKVIDNPTLEDIWDQDWPYQGVETFAHLPHTKCLLHPDVEFDIGIIGVPFDTATTYRPGARFGPSAIRKGSQRQNSLRGFNFRADINPYTSWAKVIDCGDIPVTPMDNDIALKMMTKAFESLLLERNGTANSTSSSGKTVLPPRLMSLGGDHSILLPILRALHKVYGRITVVHFDSHLDTWSAKTSYPGYWHSDTSEFTHGSMLWSAAKEGLLAESNNLHVGLRTRLAGWEDYDVDDDTGFTRIEADEILELGVKGMADKILSIVPKDKPVYVSVDIDVIDPGSAPGTGTMECGGFLTRELIYMLRQMENLNIVGGDVVEVAPAYDPLEITSLAGAQVAYELITNMVKHGPVDESLIKRTGSTELGDNVVVKDEEERIGSRVRHHIFNNF
ncbi:related to agmatinase [Saccharomycodes ludwigii]|uniref:Related to agmatinase n=1 Tax=Saccharomycodes ludwigii TaxID=36035 RepID=A0A376B3W4_9ASCO|nr:hypothetical protein SCDLUD_002845 [Saccharomycodes ludwigii]KAH3901353.1 hypothetical protein SCDLUD_002845 [Saccharomycodes ludwigii]SSD59376.1 related to agmatinase [Saccharomycodes ludwigii]